MAALIFVHPAGYTNEIFRDQVAAFPEADAVSLPGHPEGEALESVDECADWLSRYLRWRRTGPAVVGGCSLGGAIALAWALRFPADCAGLILIGTGAKLRVSDEIVKMIREAWPECVKTLVGYSLGPNPPPGLRERAEAQHLAIGQASTLADYLACNDFDVRDQLGGITAPALVIVGADDQMTPPKYSRFLNEKIAGSRLVEVPGAGHLVMAEKPAEVNAAINDWLPGPLGLQVEKAGG